jgi:hypothetical protein
LPITNRVETLAAAQHAAKLLRAYLECSNSIQTGIREMLDILSDPETDEDAYEMTLFTLEEALFPKRHKGTLGVGLAETEPLDAEQSPGNAGSH